MKFQKQILWDIKNSEIIEKQIMETQSKIIDEYDKYLDTDKKKLFINSIQRNSKEVRC